MWKDADPSYTLQPRPTAIDASQAAEGGPDNGASLEEAVVRDIRKAAGPRADQHFCWLGVFR